MQKKLASKRKSGPKKLELSSEEKILRAYIDLSHEIGVVNITLQKIADQAKVAFSTVRYYFATNDKVIHDEAFKVSMNHSYDLVEDFFVDLRTSQKFNPVHAYADAMFRWISEFPAEGGYLIYQYYMSSTNVEMQIGVKDSIEKARLRVEGLLNEAIGRGIYKPVADPSVCASHIHANTVGYGFIALGLHDKRAFKSQLELCRKSLDGIMLAHEKS